LWGEFVEEDLLEDKLAKMALGAPVQDVNNNAEVAGGKSSVILP
jgi:hypothetical protein